MPSLTLIQLRRGDAAAWTAANPVLSEGEPGVENDTNKFKIGDGVTTWNALPYQGGGGGGSGITQLTGDVTAGPGSGSQAATIAADVVNNTKIRNSGALSVIGRSANSTGDPADISATAATDAVLRESGSVLGFGTVATAGIANLAITDAKVATANKDGAAGTPSMRTLGTGAAQAAAGNDARLSDARTPTAHTHPIATDITGLGASVATFLGTPSSANLATAVTGETGSGALVFATTPTLTTPVIGAATGTSLVATGDVTVQNGVAAGQAKIGAVGPSSKAGIYFGSALDSGIYRDAASVVSTDGDFYARNVTTYIGLGNSGGFASVLTAGGFFRMNAGAWESDRPFLSMNASAFGTYTAGDAFDRFEILKAGDLKWSTGAATADLRARRSAAKVLTIDDGAAGVASLAMIGDISATTKIVSSGATSGIGYATGAGGTVSQITSITTGVTLSKATGKITLFSGARASQVTNNFTLTNTAIAATDQIVITHISGGTMGAYNFAAAAGAGSAVISVRNVHTASLTEAPVIRFSIIKSVDA